jgi:hypothetical protein
MLMLFMVQLCKLRILLVHTWWSVLKFREGSGFGRPCHAIPDWFKDNLLATSTYVNLGHLVHLRAVLFNAMVVEEKIKYKWLSGGVYFIGVIPKNPSGKQGPGTYERIVGPIR